MKQEKHLLLASGSPRRRELLATLDIDFSIVPLHDVDESFPDTLPVNEVPEFLARKKAGSYDQSSLSYKDILITADTIVILDNQALGKPHSLDDAKTMLRNLSGKTHTVVTGVALTTSSKTISFSTHTEVTFDNLTTEQIDYYVDNYKPLDKAGAYGIQEWIGYIGIKSINGCYYNVMGLPIHDLNRALTVISTPIPH